MFQRRIFPELKEHLSERYITVVTGMRRVGKSTALQYLLEQVPHDNKIYLDLERIEHRYTFQQQTYKDVQIDLEIAGIDFEKAAVIALDEIQLVPEITSVIKWLYDTYPKLKFLVTGSSSFYLKNRFSESLAGRKHIFEMYPLDFLEFLQFKGEDTAVFEQFSFKPYQQGTYLKYLHFYKEYQAYGGFPEVVLTKKKKNKDRTIRDVINSYIELDIRLLSDFNASINLYRLIKLLAERVGSTIDVKKLSGISGINRQKVTGYLELLEKTYFLYTCPAYAHKTATTITKQRKIYLADTGILQQLAQVSSGQVFENQVFNQLRRIGQTNYYKKKSGQEIDFIWKGSHAFEVKETPHASDLATLKSRATILGIPNQYLISKHPPKDGFLDFIWAGHIF